MGNTQQKLEQSQKHKKSEPEVADSDFTCEICIEAVRANNKFKKSTAGNCKHDFCSDCIAKYIELKVGFNVANIKCPALSCMFSLDPLSCRPIISNHLFNKWCDLLCDAAVLNHYANRFAYCPHRDCSALIVNECKDKVQKCTCPNCKNKFCFRCKRPWHAGYRCREMEEFRDRNDVLVGELIEKKKWTRCPMCGNAVQRTGGCRLIRCRCGNIFCHACGKPRTGSLQLCCRQSHREYGLTIICVVATTLVAWLIALAICQLLK